jgi:hypothetical protein
LYEGVPAWLNEGLAVYMQTGPGQDYSSAINNAIRRDQTFTLRQIFSQPGDASQISLFYGQSYSVVKFMVEKYGREKFIEFLSKFRDGVRLEDAIQQTYGLSVDGLDNAWRESVGVSLRPIASPVPGQLDPQVAPTAPPTRAPQPSSSAGDDNSLILVLGGGVIIALVLAIAVVGGLLISRRGYR